MSVLSRRLREARGRLGLKQGELARLLNVSQGTISRWENGEVEPTPTAMLQLAQMAGYDPFQFALPEEARLIPTRAWGREVTVSAAISENEWLKSPTWDEGSQFKFIVPDVSEWGNLELSGFLVDDNTAEPEFTRQSIVICAHVKDIYKDLKYEDAVIVRRKNRDGLTNTVVRQVYTGMMADIMLMPVAGSPVDIDRDCFKIPALSSSTQGSPQSTAFIQLDPQGIVGLVVGVFHIRFPRMMPRGHRDRGDRRS